MLRHVFLSIRREGLSRFSASYTAVRDLGHHQSRHHCPIYPTTVEGQTHSPLPKSQSIHVIDTAAMKQPPRGRYSKSTARRIRRKRAREYHRQLDQPEKAIQENENTKAIGNRVNAQTLISQPEQKHLSLLHGLSETAQRRLRRKRAREGRRQIHEYSMNEPQEVFREEENVEANVSSVNAPIPISYPFKESLSPHNGFSRSEYHCLRCQRAWKCYQHNHKRFR